MKLIECENKRIEITTINGEVYSGLATDYTPADENTPEIESICIGNIEFFSNEIKNIRTIYSIK